MSSSADRAPLAGRAPAARCGVIRTKAVTTRTTVIVIGDGRTNYFPPEAWALARVRGRAKHVLWLNPEQPASWMFGDSAMREYQPHTSRIEIVHNLDSLRRVIDQLVL